MTETSLAASYERWRTSTLGRITERVETRVVLDLLGPLKRERVLDVGAGDGTYAIEAAARGSIVTAIDRDLAMLEAARARASGDRARPVPSRVSTRYAPTVGSHACTLRARRSWR